MSRSISVAVIGAGISGLACARSLRDAGAEVVVFDKARGPGGRLSTRRVDDIGPGNTPLRFDHGAPHFEVSDPRFHAVVEAWKERGLVVERRVDQGLVRDGALHLTGEPVPRLVGVPTMSAVSRELGRGLRIMARSRVEEIVRDGSDWSLVLENGLSTPAFDAVAVTIPAPQAVSLLAMSPDLAARAAEARFDGCRAVLLAFADPVSSSSDAVVLEGSALRWISREGTKPGRSAGEAWVLHASADWSDAHEEMDSEAAVARLTEAWREFADFPPPVYAAAHRWRFAQVRTPLGEPCLFDAALGMGAAGDWCAGPGVENAYLSGAALAERILEPR